ncbi:hypothetical protein [Micromonospora sp. NPDC049497]|uniref:hypothetical protein n=1 Tax=Micromonospora sp. NPDC049497 TaxID=3364273 RepID=UPI0037B07A55
MRNIAFALSLELALFLFLILLAFGAGAGRLVWPATVRVLRQVTNQCLNSAAALSPRAGRALHEALLAWRLKASRASLAGMAPVLVMLTMVEDRPLTRG